MPRLAVTALLVVAALAGCSREGGMRCEDPAQYASSNTIPPIRVPDDLTVPDESDSLSIPDVASAETPVLPVPEECLEAPPDYFEPEDSE
ncbi:MAG TPA: hypothetical protein VIM81_00960 [Gammaproteobacteria bacterium]|jgi:uncharacterized lipoprotein